MPRVPLLQIDSFTDIPFAGNPAAVVLLRADDHVDDAWMRAVAAEMNLSETAFVTPRTDGEWNLRWWTPAVEVDLCGHATLAAAHALYETGRVGDGAVSIDFHTRCGVLHATTDDGHISLDLPAITSHVRPVPDAVSNIVGTAVQEYRETDGGFAIVVLGDATAVRDLDPDFDAIASLGHELFVVTAPSTASGVDTDSRVFCPTIGIDEDPVTGAAHCALAPYWTEQLGRDRFVARQVSPRGGTMEVRLVGDRVHITGTAVTVVRGELAT